MRVFGTRLLILLILAIAAVLATATPSSAVRRLERVPDPSWSVTQMDDVDLNGEPDVGGNSTPPPATPQTRTGAGRERSEAPAWSSYDHQLWLKWVGRIWAASRWGRPF